MLKELAELEMQFLKRIFAHSSKKSLSFHVVVRYIIDLVPRYNIDLHIHSCIVVIVPESHNAFFSHLSLPYPLLIVYFHLVV